MLIRRLRTDPAALANGRRERRIKPHYNILANSAKKNNRCGKGSG